MILDVRSLNSGYRNFCLKDISFTAERGSFISILGPNGSGKTTLIRTLTGRVPATGGFIYYKERDLRSESISFISKHFSAVSQIREEIPDISCIEYMLSSRIPYFGRFQFFETREDLKIIENICSDTGVTRLLDRNMRSLSGGERQLIYVTAALVQEPDVMLLDEPTTYLDIKNTLIILDLLKRLSQTGLTVIAALHDIEAAYSYSDRILLLKEGKLISFGTPGSVITSDNLTECYDCRISVNRTTPDTLSIQKELL